MKIFNPYKKEHLKCHLGSTYHATVGFSWNTMTSPHPKLAGWWIYSLVLNQVKRDKRGFCFWWPTNLPRCGSKWMPFRAPAGPPLLQESRDNLNQSMCHCNLPIPPLRFSSISANCCTRVHKHCCPSAGQNTGQAPVTPSYAFLTNQSFKLSLCCS